MGTRHSVIFKAVKQEPEGDEAVRQDCRAVKDGDPPGCLKTHPSPSPPHPGMAAAVGSG